MAHVQGRVSVDTYTVTAGTLPTYVDKLFGGRLCAVMKERTGRDNPDCGKSTAYTSWSHSVPQGDLYSATGQKQALGIAYDSQATLPRWLKTAPVHDHDAAEARRSNLRTALHEAGHQSAPVELTSAIVRLAQAMPDHVPPNRVAAFNAATRHIIAQFAVLARAADIRYDGVTGHGFTQGAEHSDVPVLDAATVPPEAPMVVPITMTVAASLGSTSLPAV